jgi:tRNA (cmo5U34)-methyltransferase
LTGLFSYTYTQGNMAISDNTTAHTSDEYDRSVVKTIPFYKIIHSETIDLVKTLKPGVETWLDTGCGTGSLVEKALEKFPQARFYLADPSEGMLNQASRRLDWRGNSRITILPSSSSQDLLKFKNEITPSVITAILCHHYIRSQQRVEATRACFNLLEKGGVYLTFEIVSPETQAGIQAALERWGRFQINHGRAGAVVREHLMRFNVSYFPITIQEHLTLLRETGFKTAELFWLSYLQAGLYAIK